MSRDDINKNKLVIDTYNNCLKEGFRPHHLNIDEVPSARDETARRLGYTSSHSIRNILSIAKQKGMEPTYGLWVDPRAHDVPSYISVPSVQTRDVPRVRVVSDSGARQGKEYRVGVIGDAHDSPEMEKDRFLWIGSYIGDVCPDAVVQIGDFLTLDSLNTHIPNETFEGKAKPTYMRDIVSFEKALDALDTGIAGRCSPIKHITLGNHEFRLWKFEDRTPEIYGMMQTQLTKLFERHSWSWTEYGQFYFIGGVGFIHVPLTELGKAYGGKTANHRVCLDSTFDIVWGHSHKDNNVKLPKIGPRNYVRSLNVGCALPYQHVEKYALHNTTGWSWGVYILGISGGHIQSWEWTSMLELEKRYG